MMCIHLHSRKRRYFRCPTGIIIFLRGKLSLSFLELSFLQFSYLQHYIAPADTRTIGVRLAKHKSTRMDKHTSYAIARISVKHWRFFMVRYEYSQGSIEISLSGRIRSSCGFSFCYLPSRYRELHFRPYKSHNTTVPVQLLAVSRHHCRHRAYTHR